MRRMPQLAASGGWIPSIQKCPAILGSGPTALLVVIAGGVTTLFAPSRTVAIHFGGGRHLLASPAPLHSPADSFQLIFLGSQRHPDRARRLLHKGQRLHALVLPLAVNRSRSVSDLPRPAWGESLSALPNTPPCKHQIHTRVLPADPVRANRHAASRDRPLCGGLLSRVCQECS